MTQPEIHDADVSADALARVIGVDERSVRNYAKEGMPKSTKRGRYPLGACVQWYINREREAARASKGLNDLDLARQRKTIAEARKAELELSGLEGQSVPLGVHEDRMRGRLESVAGNVKALGRYHADVLGATTPELADALLDRMSDEILAELRGLSDDIE